MALQLRKNGLSTYAIGRTLEVDPGTVRNWCRGDIPRAAAWELEAPGSVEPCPRCGRFDHDGKSSSSYAYLLGVYLGDGYIFRGKRQVVLSISCDAKYPGIVAESRAAIKVVVRGRRSHECHRVDSQCIVVSACAKAWLCLFPQHGTGRKHHRRIVLEPWQQAIVDEHPGPFLRGLVHTDGWRGLNRVHVKGRDYAYPRYQFSNRSDDIRGLFTDTCDKVGVKWRRWGRWHISVARRDSVKKLDAIIGPKH